MEVRALAADSQPFSLYLGNKTTFYFPIKKIPHNGFPYLFLYQLNIIFFLSSLYQLIILLLY